jgi:hypothetical protein
MVKEVESLHTFLTVDMVRAVAHLDQVVKTLEAYSDVAQPGLPVGDARKTPEPSQAPAAISRTGDRTGGEGEHS